MILRPKLKEVREDGSSQDCCDIGDAIWDGNSAAIFSIGTVLCT